MGKRWITEGALLITIFIWGMNTPFMKVGLNYLPAIFYNALRLILAAAASWLALLYSKSYRPVDKKDLKSIFAVSICGFFFSQVFITLGLPHTTAGNASLMSVLMPLSVAVINRIFKQELLSGPVVAGMVVSLTGALLVVWGSGKTMSLEVNHMLGTFLILLSQIGSAYYTVFSKDLLEKYSAYQIITYIMTISAAAFTLLAIPDFLTAQWRQIPATAWSSMVFSGLFSLFVANFIWVWAVNIIGSTKAALYQYLTPVFTIVIAWIYLGETFGILQLLGSLIIFSGVYLSKVKVENNYVSHLQEAWNSLRR